MNRQNKFLSIRTNAIATHDNLMDEYKELKRLSNTLSDNKKTRSMIDKSNSLLISICALRSVILLLDFEIKRLENRK